MAQQQNRTIQDLPSEIVEHIANHLPNQDLLNFRSTTRSNTKDTHAVYGSRFCKKVGVKATKPCLVRLVDLLETGGWSLYVKQLYLQQHDKSAIPDAEEAVLLTRLLKSSNSIQTLIVENAKHLQETVAAILTKAPLPALVKLTLIGSHRSPIGSNPAPIPTISQPTLMQMLTAHALSLRTLNLTLLKLAQGDDWTNIFAHIRDNMNLDYFHCLELKNSHFRPAEGPDWDGPTAQDELFVLFRFLGAQRYDKLVRNQESKKLESISFRGSEAEMKGKFAVRAGLNRLLKKIGSEQFRADLPF